MPASVDIRADLREVFPKFPQVAEFVGSSIERVDQNFAHAIAALATWILGDDAYASADGAEGAKVFLSLSLPELSLPSDALSLGRKVLTTPWLGLVDWERAAFGYAESHGLDAAEVDAGVEIAWPDGSAATISWSSEGDRKRVGVRTRSTP